jgi:AhpC/TSA family
MSRRRKRSDARPVSSDDRQPGFVVSFVTRWRNVLLGMVALAFVAVVGVAVTSPSATSTHAGGADGGELAPPVRLTSIDGRRVALPSGRPGMVMLSTSACVSCFVSAKFMADYVREAPEPVDAAFISVDPHDSPQALATRRGAVGKMPYPFAIDASGDLAAAYRIASLGTVVIYDARGRIASKIVEPSLEDLRDGFHEAGVG